MCNLREPNLLNVSVLSAGTRACFPDTDLEAFRTVMQASRLMGRRAESFLLVQWKVVAASDKSSLGVMFLPVLFRCVRSSWFPFALMVLRACAVRMIERIVGQLYAIALPPPPSTPPPLFSSR